MSAHLDDLMGIKPATPVAATGGAASDAHAAAASASVSAGGAATPAQSVFLSRIFSQLVQTTRLANALPDADDHKLYAAVAPEFAAQASQVQGRVLGLLGLLSDSVRHRGVSAVVHNSHAPGAQQAIAAGRLPASRTYSSLGDSLDRFHSVVDTVDSALEQVDLLLDRHRGVQRGNTAITQGGGGGMDRGRNNQFASSHTMQKPQRLFSHLIDNSTQSWIPILTSKPNALTPLPDYAQLRREREQKQSKAAGGDKDALVPYPHPYKTEIENLNFSSNPDQLLVGSTQLFESLSAVPCTWVDTPEALEEMATELESSSEFAVDLEHHSFRSYLGLTCLMQVSTRRADWLVDTLALRAHMQRLNTSFTDPAIVKVLHGADSDIVWLQRDLGLYIVNMFDTGQAARVLEFPSFGLAYLLQHFCDVTADKKYQLADWRIRPLSAEMLLYARMDTHYLLYIYDRLRSQLIAKSTPAQNQLSPIPNCAYLLAQVLERSKQLCLKTFDKESQGPDALVADFAYKTGMTLSNDVQSRMLVKLFQLRDEIARAEDESVFYLCSNQNLAQIIQQQPSDAQQLVACCNKPTPLLVRNYAQRVLAAIAEAKSGVGSPALKGAAADADMSSSSSVLQTPSKAAKPSGSSALPPISMTPASAASALFAQLSTSTPQQQPQSSNPGWIAQSMHDDSGAMMHSGAHSPVMSADQLYSSANWTQAGKALDQGLAMLRGKQAPHSSTSIPLFDLSGTENASPLQRPRALTGPSEVTALLSPAPKSSTFALLSSSFDSKPDVQSNRAMAEARASLLSSVPAHAGAPLLQPQQTPLKSASPPMEDDSSLRTPRTGEPDYTFTSPSPMSLQIIPSPVTVPSATDAAAAAAPPAGSFTSIAGEVAPAAAAPAGGASGVAPSLASAASSSPLPTSMREIYKISNDNRRKKKKAKLGHEQGGAAGAQGMEVDEEDTPKAAAGGAAPAAAGAAADRKKKGGAAAVDGAADAGNSDEFLKTIGWGSGTSSSQAAPAAAAAQMLPNHQPNSANPPDSAKKKRRRSGSSSAPAAGGPASLSSSPPLLSSSPLLQSSPPAVVAFDYSSASLPPSNPAKLAHFQPYQDMGRDKAELKAAAGAGPARNDPNNKIYKGHTTLKYANKSITVQMDDAHVRRNAPGIPIPARNQTQQQQQQRR